MTKHTVTLFLMFIFASLHNNGLQTPLLPTLIKELRKVHMQRDTLHEITFSFIKYKTRTEYIVDLIKQTLMLSKNEFEIIMNERTLSEIINTFMNYKKHDSDFSDIQSCLYSCIATSTQAKEHKNILTTLLESKSSNSVI